MAALVAGVNYVRGDMTGQADRLVRYNLSKVTSGDIADVGIEFLAVKQAVVIGATVEGIAVCSFTGTVVTIPAGLSSDAGWLIVYGNPNFNVS
jgi:hypothetical protein